MEKTKVTKKTEGEVPELARERTKTYGAKATVKVPTVPVNLPFLKSTKYAQREIHMRLPQGEAVTLRSLFEALEESHATLDDRKPVDSPQAAMRWLLQEVARAAK